MSTKPQIELFLENESGTQQVAYPFVESDHVSLSNGMDIDTMIRQDVSMPTVTHEDLSFKVGVGDQDVSSAIVDSSVAEMTIKGKTYQNILPEPSTHVLTNNKEMFKVNEGLDPNVEIVDGVSKSAILKGQTLVNLIRPISKTILEQYQDVVGVKYIEPSTKYLLKIKNNTSEAKSFYSSEITEWTNIDIDANQTITKILTTKSTLGRNTLLQNSKTHTTEHDLSIIFIEYQDGMENWDIPYFTGMQSVKMPVLKATGKNLFNFENGGQINGLMFSNNGANNYTVSGTCTKDNTDFYAVSKDRNSGIFTRLNSLPIGTKIAVSKSSSVGRQVYLSITQKDGSPTKYVQTYTTTNNDNVIHCFIRFMNGDTFDNEQLNLQIEIGSTATSYEPYKANILSTPEEVVLREVNGVKDTLNLNTGEYIQRIGEKVFDGSQTIALGGADYNTVVQFYHGDTTVAKTNDGSIIKVLCNNFPVYAPNDVIGKEVEGVTSRRGDNQGFYFSISKTKIASRDTVLINNYLQQNPITIQYELATPIIKTVDLSSSGNWEKVVLDGRQRVAWEEGSINAFYVRENRLKKLQNYSQAIISDTGSVVNHYGSFVDGCNEVQISGYLDTQNKYPNENWLYFRIPNIKSDVNTLKQYLSQNPITVWFQTATHQDSTQVKQPIFFKNGHVIQTSGADNSLISALDYQAKTSNSYVMDLMKTNTKYTMKAKSASGTFTIDGTSYGAGTNGTFTTPTSMTNKLLVMSNKTNTEVMILEGDVTDKTIPYFKGIKSAFEDEDKIEVLSTGKNLFDKSKVLENCALEGTSDVVLNGWKDYHVSDYIPVKKGMTIYIPHTGSSRKIYCDANKKFIRQITYSNAHFTPEFDGFIRLTFKDVDLNTYQIEYASTPTNHEPYKSNNTKIPLLSPLRKLPNGVYDEVILDRESNKAKIIQRVGRSVLNGTERWNVIPSQEREKTFLFQTWSSTVDGGSTYCISNNYLYSNLLWTSYTDEGVQLGGANTTLYKMVDLRISKTKIPLGDTDLLRNHLKMNPLEVYYELETPIITEVDLEGFPYIYKDGHIFLNGEITPVTEIKYSINQSHMIEASNQDIIRHQKEIDYLYKLIGEYVRVDYKNTLLSLNLELK